MKFLASYKATILLLLAYAILLAVATLIEKYAGTAIAKTLVYYAPITFLVYVLLVINFFAATWKHKLFRRDKCGYLVIHFSFVVILAGALTTHILGKEGIIHLREGETVDYMMVQTNKGVDVHKLPFKVELVAFTLLRYPGSNSPSSYQSSLIVYADNEEIRKEISMNNVLDIKGYRLFQASYDRDERGSILSVNRDVAGRTITYTGYISLFVGFLLAFFGKGSRFRQLLKLMVFITPLATQAQTFTPEEIANFGKLPVLSSRGRVEPMNTLASEVLRKLHKANKFGEMGPDEFLLSLTTHPHTWIHTPIIAYSNKEIAFNHDLTEKYCAYVEMFDSNGNYKLQSELDEAFAKPPSHRSRYEKDLIKLDEQVNIFHQLINGEMIEICTDDTLINHRKIQAELLYNQADVFKRCKKLYLIGGALLLVFAFLTSASKPKAIVWIKGLLMALIVTGLVCHLAGIGLRWYIAGYAPWSNSYETMVYLSFITVAGGFLFVRKSSIPLVLATLFGGVVLFVAGLNWMNPQISPLVPVLQSPWLMIHVAVVMIAYGFFGISFLLGLTNIIMLRMGTIKHKLSVRINELTVINELSLWCGLTFMTAGVFLGAVWANESWGRYWGWDPKETWALITIVVYVVVTHIRLVKRWNSPYLFNLLSVLAFACVLMTYFGVNYLLSGMHSYN